ncbi:hypothetical protein EV144_10637 [Flavobacterium sp. 270]|nr:hypothetical protein EV144_10637 [Flavobacterium sp. 270]
MKIRFLICLVFSISFFTVKAQENFSAVVNVKTEPTDKIDFNETNIGFSFHKKVSAKNTITNTLEYSNLKVNYEETVFETFAPFKDLNQFNQIQNKIKFSHEVSDKTKLNITVTPTVNFQQNLAISDLTVLGSFELNQQLNPNASITIGAARTTAFGDPKFMPVFSFNYKFNEQSDISIGFPDSRISYANNDRNRFSVTNSFNGNYYNLDTQNDVNYNASKAVLSQMTSAVEYERNVTKNWFLNFKAGYDFNKKYNLIDNDNHKVYDFNTGNGYILGIGIKYKQ